MIERLLAAERALADGDLDRSERLYGQVAEADPRNAIAVVGLAAVAERRGDRAAASDLVERALAIDPEDDAALRMRAELARPAEPALEREPEASPAPAPEASPPPEASPAPEASPPPEPERRSFLARLLALLRWRR